jgi:peptidoglycan/LPS O-acetylase OafA/YrhL
VATYQWFVPATVLCTALLVPVLVDQGGWLSWAPLRAVGRRSYGLYLWGSAITYLIVDVYHWGGPAMLATVFAATFLVTEVTYRLVEVPLRRLGRRSAGAVRRSPASAPAPGAPLLPSAGRP